MARYFAVVDTETRAHDGKKSMYPNPNKSVVYDFGYAIVNAKGDIVFEKSYVVQDVFFDFEKFQSAYYADKFNIYINGIRSGEWQVKMWADIVDEFIDVCNHYGIKEVWAYNANFDSRAIASTCDKLGTDPMIQFGIKWRDIWDYASNITCTQRYVNYVTSRPNGLTANGNPRTNAESVIRYLRDDNYVEAHTALSDVRDELFILNTAKKRHRRTQTTTRGRGWVWAAKTYQNMR